MTEDDVELNAQILLELTDGVTATLTYSGCHVPNDYDTEFYFTDGVVKVSGGSHLIIYENNEYVNYGGTANLLEEQLAEFVKFLKDEESEIVTPEYGKEVIAVIEKIYEC